VIKAVYRKEAQTAAYVVTGLVKLRQGSVEAPLLEFRLAQINTLA